MTKADVEAAYARAQEAEQKAAAAETAAKDAWADAYEAQRAATQEAAYARELNSEAGSLLAQYNSTLAKANAAFALGSLDAQMATYDLGEASRDQEALNYLKQQDATLIAVTIPGGGLSGSGSSGSSLSCGGSAMLTTGIGSFQAGTCSVSSSSSGSGSGQGTITVYVHPDNSAAEASLESNISELDGEAKTLMAASRTQDSQGRSLQAEADGLHKRYEATKAAAAKAAGEAAAAQRYANEEFSKAKYLTQVANDDEAAAKKAEQAYQAILKQYQAEQRAKPKPKPKPKAAPSPAPGGGVGAPPVLPPAGPGSGKPPSKTIRALANDVILVAQAVYSTVTEGIESAATSVASCATQPQVGSCLEAAAAVGGLLLGDGEGDAALGGAGDLADAGAADAAGDAAGPVASKPIAVIGRLPDTAVAANWPGHEILDIPDWTPEKNDEWDQSVIDRGLDVYVASNPTPENLFDTVAGRQRPFGRELDHFEAAGYTWDGWMLRAPGGR